MIFLIALHKKANRFDLGIEGQEKELAEYSQMLTIEYINKKLNLLIYQTSIAIFDSLF